MALTVDFDEIRYQNQKKQNQSNNNKKNINELIDDIVFYLVKKCSLLINDISKNGKPVTLIKDEIENYIRINKVSIEGEKTFDEILTRVNYYLWGYGPLQPYINDPDVSDIEVYNKDTVKIKKLGKREKVDVVFPSNKALLNYCYTLAIKNGGSLSDINAIQILSDSQSQKDAILRIDICISPVSSVSSNIVIRKLPRNKKSLSELIKAGMLNEEMKEYFIKAVKAGLNMVFTGRGGSGKSTLMNGCLDYVPENESQLIMQESEELFTNVHEGTYYHKVKKRYGESDIEYTLKDLTINALLMSLDRMVIGEIKNEEAMEFFNAVYSGHIGWTSVHSPSATECINKIIHLMKYSNTDLSKADLKEMLVEVDLIIFMKNYKCYQVYEIKGFDENSKEILWNPVFEYKIIKKDDGSFEGHFERINNSCEKVLRKFKEAEIKGYI